MYYTVPWAVVIHCCLKSSIPLSKTNLHLVTLKFHFFFFFKVSKTLQPIPHSSNYRKTCNPHVLQLQCPTGLYEDSLKKSTKSTKPLSHCHQWCLRWLDLVWRLWVGFRCLNMSFWMYNWPLAAVPERHWSDVSPMSYLPDPHRYLGYHRVPEIVLYIKA